MPPRRPGEQAGDPFEDRGRLAHGQLYLKQRSDLVAEGGEEVIGHLVTVDPGLPWVSDAKPNRRLLDWPDDLAELADRLGIERFAVVGVSGGGPHAAACAYKHPQRVTRLALVSSAAPIEVPPAEQGLLAVPGFVEIFIADAQEASSGGGAATAQDLALVARPWGFRPEEILVPVLLWQGEQDTNVSPAMGEYLARVIPNCQATFCPGEGHLVGFTRWEEILQAVSR